MKKFLFLLLVLTFYGCEKTEDDTGLNCITDCTTLQGRFVTMNNEGVPGVKISINYRSHPGTYGVYIRKIAQTVTDQNGNFYKDFYIKDEELGESAEGYFQVIIDDSKLDVNKYILSDNQVGNSTSPLDYAIYSVNIRDTIIGGTYYLPKKTHIKVNLNNFIPQQEGDYFEVKTLYPYGAFNDSEQSYGHSGYGGFRANGLNSQLAIFAAENEQNYIRLVRRKNGVNSTEEFPLFVPSNNSIELTYDY